MKLHSLKAIQILDSRGWPTLSVQAVASNGAISYAQVPSGASTGKHEACELRDHGSAFFGKGVLKAQASINETLHNCLKDQPLQQAHLDRLMIEADGTDNRSHLGANALVGTSMAIARLISVVEQRPLYRSLASTYPSATLLPLPMINVINGGMHADNGLLFQEFMIQPIHPSSFREGLQLSAETFQMLRLLLKEKKLSTAVGDEGGFAPRLASCEAALDLIIEAIDRLGYQGKIGLALDCAASVFYDPERELYAGRSLKEHLTYLKTLTERYPILSIEDGLAEEDWRGWKEATHSLKVQLVGDDLFVTQRRFLERGIQENVANAILIKLNQVGTVTEALETVRLAQKHGYKVIVSHRSGDTEDPFIADFAVACQANAIKSGSLCRSERTAKYNRLLWIEEECGR